MPYFLELPTYRWREHCGPGYDNDIGYRSDLNLSFKQKDPIESLSQQLDSDQVKEVTNEIEMKLRRLLFLLKILALLLHPQHPKMFTSPRPQPMKKAIYIHVLRG